MIAVGEKLCNLDANEESRRLDSNNTCVFIEPPIHWDEMPEEYASTASQIVIILVTELSGVREAKMHEILNLCYSQRGEYPVRSIVRF